MRHLFLVLLYLVGAARGPAKEKTPATYSIPLPPNPDFSSLQWLVGEWTGKTTGRGPQGDVHLTVNYLLEKKFLVLKEEITLGATKNAPEIREAWMGVLSATGSDAGFLLQTYSTTGFITRYRVAVEGGEVRFVQEGGEQLPAGWLFRRTLRRSGNSELEEAVQAAPPGKPFFEFYTAAFTRETPH